MSLFKKCAKIEDFEKVTHFLISFQPNVPIATKLCRMVTYRDGPLPLKSIDHLITWSCKVTWQTKIIISLLQQRFWPPNLAGWKLTLMASCLKSLIKPLITLSCEITWQTMATRRDKMAVYLDKLLPIKSHDPLITWFYKIMWQTKIISSLPQCLWPDGNLTW